MASGVEVKGPHICCKQCVSVVGKILEKVDGVSEASCDVKTKTVKFTAKDAAAAKAGFKALLDGGFFGTATEDGKEIKLDIPAVKKGEKVNTITVKDVHVVCGQCKNAVSKTFEGSKITYQGTGPQLTVRIEGRGARCADATMKSPNSTCSTTAPPPGRCMRQSGQRLLPLDETWRRKLAELPSPKGNLPDVMGGGIATLRALIREYLFVSLFRACAESLVSENASRLAAMQRADKNINELLEDLNRTFHRLRQNGIDEELFDVISGFEALSAKKN